MIDWDEARIECLRATAWFQATMERLRQMPEATRATFEEAARAYFSRLAADLDQPRNYSSDPHEFDLSVDYRLHLYDERRTDLAEQLKRNEFDGYVSAHALALAQMLGLQFDALTVHQKIQISQLAVRAEIAQSELLRHQLTSPLAPFEASDALFRVSGATAGPEPKLPRSPTPSNATSLKAAAEQFVGRKRAKGITESQIAELERALGWLQEVAGPEASLLDVTKEMLRRFRDDLSRRNVTLRGRKVPFRHSLTDEPDHQIQFQTAIRYWGSVQAFFAWVFSEGLSLVDPAAGLIMDRPKSITKRSPRSFDADELKRLFQTPLFAGHKSTKRITEPGTCLVRDGRWWFAVLAMHSGARAGELCQLLPTDFVFDDAGLRHGHQRARDVPPVRRDDLLTNAYQDIGEGEWSCSATLLDLDQSLMPNRLGYYVLGDAYAAKRLRLKLYVNSPDRAEDGEHRFRTHCREAAHQSCGRTRCRAVDQPPARVVQGVSGQQSP